MPQLHKNKTTQGNIKLLKHRREYYLASNNKFKYTKGIQQKNDSHLKSYIKENWFEKLSLRL